MQIDAIKQIWKEQKAKDIEVRASEHYSSLLDEIKRNEKKIKRNYTLMSLVMIFTIIFIDKTAIERMPDKTWLTWAGYGLIFFAITAIVFVSWATVIKFKVNGVTESSLEFLKSAREKYRLRNKIRTTVVPLYLFTLTLGITLTYIQITEPLDFIIKFLIFFLLYLFIALVSFFTIKKEKRKYLKTIKPIEDKMDMLLQEE